MPLPPTPAVLHRYRAFGLEVASEVACPEFLPGSGDPEVTLHRGAVPPFLAAPWADDAFMEVEGPRLLFRVPEVGRFLVEEGRRITVEADPATDPDLVRIYLLGSVFGGLLQQRGCLTLHGSALVGRRGAYLLTGESGAGKSTLAARLAARGVPVLSDDVCALTFSAEGTPLLHPAYPRLHLRPDAVAAVAPDPARIHPSRKAVEKDALDLREAFGREPHPLRTVFWLDGLEAETLTWEPLVGLVALTALVQNTYRTWYLEPMGRLGDHFHQAAAVAAQARVFRLHRTPGLADLDRLADLIQHLESGEIP